MTPAPVPTILGTLPAGASSGTVAVGQGDWSGVIHLDQPAYVWVSNFYVTADGHPIFDRYHDNAAVDGIPQWNGAGFDFASWRALPAGDHTVAVIGGANSWGIDIALANSIPEPAGLLLLGALAVGLLLRRKRK